MNALRLFMTNAKINWLTLLYFFRAVAHLWKLVIIEGKTTGSSISEAKTNALSGSQFTELYTLRTLYIQLTWNKNNPNDQIELVSTESDKDE